MEEARSNCSFKTCDCEERDRMRTHIKGRQKGFYVYSSCGEMGDTVEGASVMVVSCTGLQCPPDPLSTALCAPTPPAEASTCPLTEAPAGKRMEGLGYSSPLPSPSSPPQAGWVLTEGGATAAPPPLGGRSHSRGLSLSLLSLPRPRGVGPGRLSSPC